MVESSKQPPIEPKDFLFLPYALLFPMQYILFMRSYAYAGM